MPPWLRLLRRWTAVCVAAWVLLTTASALKGAWSFTTDDAYIALRYARHLAAGQGIVWNVGEPPVEGFSNFSFVVLAALGMKLGLDGLAVVKCLGAGGLLAAVVASYVLSLRWVGPAAAALPAVLFTSFRGVITWSVSGLESGAYVALCLAAIAGTVYALDRKWDARFAAMLALAAALTRAEGVVVGVSCGIALAVCDRRSGIQFAVAFLGPYAVFTTFRFAYFGHLLPNSVLCKAGWQDDPWRAPREFLSASWPLLTVAAAYPPKLLDAGRILLWAIVLTQILVFRGVDPVLSGDNRYFLLSIALASVLATATASHWVSVLARARAGLLEPLVTLHAVLALTRPRAEAAQQARNWGAMYWFRMDVRAALGRYLRDTVPATGAYVLGDVGVVGTIAPQRSIDSYCLNSAAMTSSAIGKRAPAFVDWMLRERPDAIVVHAPKEDPATVMPYLGVYPELVARAAFKDEYRLTTRFGTPEGFWYFVYSRAAKPQAGHVD